MEWIKLDKNNIKYMPHGVYIIVGFIDEHVTGDIIPNILINERPYIYDSNGGWRTINKQHIILSEEDILNSFEYYFIPTQPERSKREDSQKCEMRCSEHCGNTVREAQ